MIEKKIKIGFISKRNPLYKKVWSGTIYQLYKSLISINNVEVVWIPAENSIFRKLILTPFTLPSKLLKKNHTKYFIPISKFYNKSIDRKLIDQVDILFVPSQTLYFAYLKTNKPIIYLTDATFKQIYNYYTVFSNFSNLNIKHSNLIHQQAYHKAWKIIASSNWTRDSLIDDYHIEPQKIKIMEFGANIDQISNQNQDPKPISKCLNILFFGVEWDRKGGDVAVETVEALNKMGINACLDIVGVEEVPSQHKNKKYINEFGFLDKNKEEDTIQLKKLIQRNHILLLPSKAECAGIVFCEASAYGLPAFAYDTGGVSNYVINSKNGYLLDIGATGYDFARKIKEVIYDNNELEPLRKNCIDIYNQKLNWKIWTNNFIDLLEECRVQNSIK